MIGHSLEKSSSMGRSSKSYPALMIPKYFFESVAKRWKCRIIHQTLVSSSPMHTQWTMLAGSWNDLRTLSTSTKVIPHPSSSTSNACIWNDSWPYSNHFVSNEDPTKLESLESKFSESHVSSWAVPPQRDHQPRSRNTFCGWSTKCIWNLNARKSDDHSETQRVLGSFRKLED